MRSNFILYNNIFYCNTILLFFNSNNIFKLIFSFEVIFHSCRHKKYISSPRLHDQFCGKGLELELPYYGWTFELVASRAPYSLPQNQPMTTVIYLWSITDYNY